MHVGLPAPAARLLSDLTEVIYFEVSSGVKGGKSTESALKGTPRLTGKACRHHTPMPGNASFLG